MPTPHEHCEIRRRPAAEAHCSHSAIYMEPPHPSVPRHSSHYSRSTRHRTRAQPGRQLERKPSYGRLRPSLPSDADGNKEILIQGWLEDLEARRQGVVSGTARHPYTAEISNHESPPHPLHYPPRLRTINATSQSHPGQDGLKRTHGEHHYNALDPGPIVVPEVGLFHDTDLAATPQRHRLNPTAVTGSSEKNGIRRRRRRQEDASVNSSSFVPPHEDLRFQKKPRRKTRTDRYDLPKNNNATTDKQRKGPGQRPEKSKKRKDTLISTKEVMEKFHSASILNERITVGVVATT